MLPKDRALSSTLVEAGQAGTWLSSITRRVLASCPLAFALLCCLCDAPRDNPLDPALGGNIDGRALTRRATGIPGAEVLVPGANLITHTDSSGRFFLRGLSEDSLWVLLSAEGYAPESARVDPKKGRIDSLTCYLNGLPYLTAGLITTHVYGQSWPPEPLYFCRLTAQAGDRDGDADVDSVWAEIPGIGFSQRLVFDPDSDEFIYTLWGNSIPGQSLETLVGLPVTFKAADEMDDVSYTLGQGVSRIIYDLPEPVFPAGGLDTVATDTAFIWQCFNHGFWVRYHNEVVRIQGGGPAGVVAEFDGAEPTDTTYRFSSALLQPGDYYWTVEAIDAFGNSARSAEELFHAR